MNKEEAKNKKSNMALQFDVEQDEERENVLSFIGSNEDPDRHGDVVVSEGWDITNYKKNPVFLWGHDYEKLPVGKAINVFVDKVTKALRFDIEFAVNEYPFAETVYKLYKGGFLNAVSVGFMVKDFHIDEEGTWYLDETELLELSAVTVPANPSALLAGMKKGLFSNREIKELNKHMDYKNVPQKEIAKSQETKDDEILGEEENEMPKQKVTVELDLDTTIAEKKLDSLLAKIKELSESKEIEEVIEEVEEKDQPEEKPEENEESAEDKEVIKEENSEVKVEENTEEVEEKSAEKTDDVNKEEKKDEEESVEEPKESEEPVKKEESEIEESIEEDSVQEEVEEDFTKSFTDCLIKSVKEKIEEEIK